MSRTNRIEEEDVYGDDAEEQRANDAEESASATASHHGRCSHSGGALEKAKAIQDYKREEAILNSKIIRFLLSLLLLACTSTKPAALSSASKTCPDGGIGQTNSVTCRAGFTPDCTGCGPDAKCGCIPIPKK